MSSIYSQYTEPYSIPQSVQRSPPPHSLAVSLSTPSFPSSGPANVFPPEYNSIPEPSRTAQKQAERNREKQLLRDQRQPVISSSRIESPRQPPASVEPDSHSSGSGGIRPGNNQSRTSVDTLRELGVRGILPEGMDVREALAKCEDPTLGWSLQFWVTIADPLNGNVFFACPANGQCSWDPPIGAFVVPRSPEGEWWELADATRKNRSYYYNTMTGKTQWTRPGGEAFVIPLGLIQRHALPPKERTTGSSTSSLPSHLRPNVLSPTTFMESPSSILPETPRTPGPRPSSSTNPSPAPPSPNRLPQTSMPQAPITSPPNSEPELSHMARSIPSDPISLVSQTSGDTVPWTPLSIVDEGSGNEGDFSDNSGPTAGWWEKRKSRGLRFGSPPSKEKGKARSEEPSLEANGNVPTPISVDVAPPSLADTSALPKMVPLKPIHVESSYRTKRMSTGLHPLLPPDIATEIQSFQTDDFAHKYFATKRQGLLRGKVPLERIMEWQKSPITTPLLVISKTSHKDAVMSFKVIQHVMGERDRFVEGAKMGTSSSASNLAGMHLGERKRHGNGGSMNGNGNGNGEMRSEKMVVLEEIRWMINVAVTAAEMRDEVFCQLVKQLTRNPDHDAVVLGFQLFCILVNAFGPSNNFEPFVKNFLQKSLSIVADGIGVMSRYCLGKLDVYNHTGGRSRLLTIGEIEHASDAAFYPSVYGESLDRIMDLQSRSYPDLKIPVILPFLADGILALGGLASEGIFRVPGDADSVSELKSRMDRGHYQLKGIDDPHVAASLFKLWLRELEQPLVPAHSYNAALSASSDAGECIAFVQGLPTFNRRVLLFVVSFFQLFLQERVVEITKMTPANLALVLAPNLLRTESKELSTVFTNSSFESKFVQQLLEFMKPGEVDSEYRPSHGRAAGPIRT